MSKVSKSSVATRVRRPVATILAVGLAGVLGGLGLAGCGQKGPLTLPAPATPSAAASAPR